jgi:hypothetical protein
MVHSRQARACFTEPSDLQKFNASLKALEIFNYMRTTISCKSVPSFAAFHINYLRSALFGREQTLHKFLDCPRVGARRQAAHLDLDGNAGRHRDQ